MRLALELGLALGAGLVAYKATTCRRADVAESVRYRPSGSGVVAPLDVPETVPSARPPAPSAKRVANEDLEPAQVTPQKQHEESVLRNAAIVAASKSMASRKVTLDACFGPTPVVDTLKLRFTVEISSDPKGEVARAWRFDQVIVGQALPTAFGACAADILGRDLPLVAPDGDNLPSFDGELVVVYTIERRPMDAVEAGDAPTSSTR